MAYGGTPLGPPAVARSSPAMKQVKLDKESELRIEVNFNSSLRLRLLNGTTEIFGTEMPPENWLIFPPRMKFAIFTWYGATIEMQDEIPMIRYVNVHAVLEGRRNLAKASPSDYDASQGLIVALHLVEVETECFMDHVLVLLATRKGVCRLLKIFILFGPFSINFGIRLLMILRYRVQLENGLFNRRTADFLWMMIYGSSTLLDPKEKAKSETD